MMTMNKKAPSVICVLFFSYLFVSVCFSAPASAAALGNYAPMISTLPMLHQLFIAALLSLDATVDIGSISCFSPPVQNCIKHATSADVLVKIAASISLLNVINICVKLNALIKVNPALFSIISAKADVYAQVLDGFFKGIEPVSAVAKLCLDVRALPNFAVALSAAGVAFIPCLINFALIIHLCLVFNTVFLQVCHGLFPELAAAVAVVLGTLEGVLISVSLLLGGILATIVGLLGGVLGTVAALLNGLVFPLCYPIVNCVYPPLCQLFGQELLNQLVPFPGPTFPIPSATLAQASNLFQLLNSAT